MAFLRIGLLLLPAWALAGCQSGPTQSELEAERKLPTAAYMFRALADASSNPEALAILRNTQMEQFRVTDTVALDVLRIVENIYARNAAVDGKGALPVSFADAGVEKKLRGARVSLVREAVSFAEIYDRLCASAGVVWWVQDKVFVASETKGEAP